MARKGLYKKTNLDEDIKEKYQAYPLIGLDMYTLAIFHLL